jgi:hypothetical protein
MTQPASALDPGVMLATSIHAQPGVYALLLGSGVSTGAGIPTGWGVVRELVRRAAAASAPDDAAAAERAGADPEQWWAAHGDGEPLGYSNLLGALASVPAARRGLLAGFFEPSMEDLEEGLKVPGPGHRAIAELVKRGLVRVIITTNFDRLVEKALEDAGVSPQIVSRPEAVPALTPLAHAPATVIKIHGDYADLDMRNTVEELDTYPPEWTTLLQRVFDEYGLLISGWSGEWDKALVRHLEEVKPRRYPLFWDSRSSGGGAAQRLLALHSGTVITAESADDLFHRLLDSIDALDRLTEAPLTTALAVARLKRFLPDPLRRIDLHDLVMDRVAQAADHAGRQPVHAGELTGEFMENVLAKALADVTPVLHLLTTGVVFDRDGKETDLWVDAIRRLMQARGPIATIFLDPLDYVRHYPALLTLRAVGLAALHAGRDDVLLRLLLEPKYRDRQRTRDPIPAVQALHDRRVLDDNLVRAMPRWGDQRPLYPASHLLRADLRDVLRPFVPDDADYKALNDQYEFRTALVLEATQDVPRAYRAPSGEYVDESRWLDDGQLCAEAEFVAVADEADDSWPWWRIVGGGPIMLTGTLDGLREILKGYVRYRWR